MEAQLALPERDKSRGPVPLDTGRYGRGREKRGTRGEKEKRSTDVFLTTLIFARLFTIK